MKIGISFSNEQSKIKDMKNMTKSDFLAFYSYLTKEDYFATCKDLFSKKCGCYWQEVLIDKLIPQKLHKDIKLLFALYAQSSQEIDLLIERYFNEYVSTLTYSNGNVMNQFYHNMLLDNNLTYCINYIPYKVAIDTFNGE